MSLVLDSSDAINRNRLLALFPTQDMELLRPYMEQISLAHGQHIIVPDEPISDVYFPLTAMLSLVTTMEDGASVESGIIGKEGMSGLPVLLDAYTTPMPTLAQVPGDAIRISSKLFKEAFDKSRELQKLLHRYLHAVVVTTSQTAACNRLHKAEARLCRWLLMSSDGIGSDEIGLTHEFLSVMLGIRRAGVTVEANRLRDAGIIDYRRGNIRILDRERMQEYACECYRIVKKEFDRVLS